MKLFLFLFLLLCFSFKRLKVLTFVSADAIEDIANNGILMDYAKRLAVDTYSQELKFFERTITALNDTVNRLRCPVGWTRGGRSCYVPDSNAQPDYQSAQRRCIALAGKPTSEGDHRIFVSTLKSPIELHSIAGLMAKTDLNRVQMKMSKSLTKSVALFYDKLDRLFMTKTHASGWLSNRRHCTSVSVQNIEALFMFIQREEEELKYTSPPVAAKDSSAASTACFVLDFAPSLEFQQCAYLASATASQRRRIAALNTERELDEDTLQLRTNGTKLSHPQLLNNSHDSLLFDVTEEKRMCEMATGHCTLIYNEQCSCPDRCNFICEYSTDLCTMNPLCGSNGRCVDSIKSGLKCECNFLYGGSYCDKVTADGIQVLVCVILIVITTLANSWILRRALASILRIPGMLIRYLFVIVRICKNPLGRKDIDGVSRLGTMHHPHRPGLLPAMEKLRPRWLYHKSCRTRGLFGYKCIGSSCCKMIGFIGGGVGFFSGRNNTNSRRTSTNARDGNLADLKFSEGGRVESVGGQPKGSSIECNGRLTRALTDQGLAASAHGNNKVISYKKHKLRRTLCVSAFTLIISTILLATTSVTQMMAFRSDFSDEHVLRASLNRSLHIVKRCQMMTNFVQENLISFPFAVGSLFVFAWFTKRETYCRHCLDGRPGLPTPMEPFKMKNRFTTAIIFGLLSCEVLKIFEELLFKTSAFRPLGILIDLSVRIGFVFLIGMRYYPLLSSLQLRTNAVCTGVACVYAWFDMIYVVVKQGFCMGFVPISSLSGLVGEARLRLELGSWYVIYGLIRNAPHFACLAYITSEFSVRFFESLRNKTNLLSRVARVSDRCGITDSQDSQLKLYDQDLKGYYSTSEAIQKLFPSGTTQLRMPPSYASAWDGLRDAKLTVHHTSNLERFFSLAFTDSAPNHLYVRNLFRSNVRRRRSAVGRNKKSNSDYYVDEGTHDNSRQRRFLLAVRRFLSSFYVWRPDFRYSTIAVCTFVTAFIFLYYLACTLAFYHLSRTEGHGFVLNFYFRHIINVWPAGDDSTLSGNAFVDEKSSALSSSFFNSGDRNALTFWREICIASLIAYLVFAVQMFQSMKQYRINKLMMYKGIFEDIPSARHIKPSKMIAQSVHYSGFLVGYMAWGFIIVFYICLIATCTLSLMFRQRVQIVATIIAFLVPVCMVYALKIILVRSASKAMFTQGSGSMMALNNRKIHAAFVYFNFFFDCFLGIVACLSRLCSPLCHNCQSCCWQTKIRERKNVRMTFVGRPLERLDPGFSIYVAFLHTEVAHTHPVMVTFCDMIWRRIVLRRVGLLCRQTDYTTQHTFKFSATSSGSSKSLGLPLIRPHRCERARFRWLLCYTLLRNNGLLSFRKSLSARLQRIVLNHNRQLSNVDARNPRNGGFVRSEFRSGMLHPTGQHPSQTSHHRPIREGGDFDKENELADIEPDQISLNESRMLKDGDLYIVPPSMKVYSTTGVGKLKASAGEHVEADHTGGKQSGKYGSQNATKLLQLGKPETRNDNEFSELNCISEEEEEEYDSEEDETAKLLKPPLVCDRKSLLPLVLDTAYLAISSMSTGCRPQGVRQTAAHRQRGKSSNVAALDSSCGFFDQRGELTNDASLHDVGTVLRMASYSERDALWRQGVRERVSRKSRYRFHYGCLNQLPAVKVVDFAHYRHIATQRQRKIRNDSNKETNSSVYSYSCFASEGQQLGGSTDGQQQYTMYKDRKEPSGQLTVQSQLIDGAVVSQRAIHRPARPPPPQKPYIPSCHEINDDTKQNQLLSESDKSNLMANKYNIPSHIDSSLQHSVSTPTNIQHYSRSPSRNIAPAATHSRKSSSTCGFVDLSDSISPYNYQSSDIVTNVDSVGTGENSLMSTTTGDDQTYATAHSIMSEESGTLIVPAMMGANFLRNRRYFDYGSNKRQPQ